jgi:hypothetical protein
MPKRTRDKYNTLLVKFYENATDKEVRSVLAHMGLNGTRVSTLVRRWAVEVPYWLEGDYIVKFYNNDMVEAIHNSFNKTEESEEQGYEYEENNQ